MSAPVRPPISRVHCVKVQFISVTVCWCQCVSVRVSGVGLQFRFMGHSLGVQSRFPEVSGGGVSLGVFLMFCSLGLQFRFSSLRFPIGLNRYLFWYRSLSGVGVLVPVSVRLTPYRRCR